MARIIPSDLAAIEYSNSHSGEIEILRRLQKELPNEFTVFHSLHWSNERPSYTVIGEIDFVIINQSGSILVIEQKNGVLDETAEGLVKRYGRDSKNVAGQVHRSINNIQQKLKNYHGGSARYEIDYMILLPDYKVVRMNAAGIDPSRVVDQSAIGELAARIEKLLGKGSHIDPAFTQSVINFFNQSFEVVPAVSTYVTTQKKNYTRMLEGLGDVIDSLEFSPFRLRVLGTAGSGKSQLTMRFYQQALSEGKRVLLLCYNRPLADRLQTIAGEHESVDSFHGFCARVAERAGIDLDYSKTDFWSGLLDEIYTVDVADEDRYDCLIVDEGQDFEEEWYEILKCFLTDSAAVLWLEDPLQNLQGKEAVPLVDFVTYREAANFRTPTVIASFAKKSLGVSFKQKNPLPGLGVSVHEYEHDNEQEKIVAHRINDLQRIGFKLDEIVVVSCHGKQKAAFRDLDRVGQYTLRKSTADYDENRQQIYTDGQIYFETIYRFKGQQAPAIIVTDIHAGMGDNDWARRLLYCAMTRATVRLELIVSKGSYWGEVFSKLD
jgi:hypothetical protein